MANDVVVTDVDVAALDSDQVIELMAKLNEKLTAAKAESIAKLRAANVELAAKIAANNAEIAKLGGKTEAAKGSKVSRHTREAIVAVIDGNSLTPPEIAKVICVGPIFYQGDMDNDKVLSYVHTELANGVKKGTILRDGDTYTLAVKE
ncbi:MAG: hypothetical protein AABY32_01975 [Nanoarchaeota archaeon]